ncbi:4-oxalocrotonate tautomerase family protein, partial [Pseudomonas fluorescens]|nr:4-oxalocrotonate tautomerase family protein [Pseudomonas fluorescens]
MPLITVSYASSRQSPSLKADIASAVSELTAKILHKDPRVTAIIVKPVDASDWFAGGRSLAEQKLASYWIDIHVTEGTNTKDEKAAYLAAM